MFGNKMNAVEKAINKNHVGTLIDLGGNKDREVSMAAIAGLGSVGGDEASHYLVSRLHSTEPDVRVAVAKALGMMGNKHTKAFLSAQMNKETDPEVKEIMRQEMSKIKEY